MKRAFKKFVLATTVAVMATGFAGCGGGEGLSDEAKADVVANYVDGAYSSYQQSLGSTEALDSAVDVFLDNPTEANLVAARGAWLAARDDYAPTEAFRFYGGPSVAEETNTRGGVNAWPIDAAFIDYVDGSPESGIINDIVTYPLVAGDALSSLNQTEGATKVTIGWHAIEFLLWGEDPGKSAAGDRPVSDFVDAPNASRRSLYLAEATDLLLASVSSLAGSWAPEQDNYRSVFEALDPDEALRRIMVGVGELSQSELAGQRMNVASQQDYSDFSDNTTNDLIGSTVGIQRVLTGDYPGVSGPGIAELIDEVDTELAAELLAITETSVELVEAIPAPFDQHLGDSVSDNSPGRQQILASVAALEEQAQTIVAAAFALGLTITVS